MSLSSHTPQSPVSYTEYRTQLESLLRTPPTTQSASVFQTTPIRTTLTAARLLLAYVYGLSHDEQLESTLVSIDQRAGALLEELDPDEDSGLDGGVLGGKYEGRVWAWIDGIYSSDDDSDEDDDGGSGSEGKLDTNTQELKALASHSAPLLDLITQGRHIRPSLHPFNLYRFIFHSLPLQTTTALLRLLRSTHLPQTRKLLSFGATTFACPQWCLLTALHRGEQRAELERLCAHLLERAHADSTPIRARFRLVSQALALAPPTQLRALVPQWALVSREVEEALQGADPYADVAAAAAAAGGFGAGLGLGTLPSIDIRDLSAGMRSWSASVGSSVGRMVSGVWR
ncbi:unnamed protein product [Tilletia controversa]|uniref:Uncharacterized protein n=2 Tax=Tilletia TaxID=13289 RepID=A0A8X7MRY4_9BASI|nr:hypothetical protein CF328_g4810 [Tilletia controversa]KAE8257801.1 hypothetical protein A4X03_0g4561 [Tilletia caries]KAE8247183.1 hypothetical protein A4X06_0g4634 [Tilletia controversa]CAD6904463.1 unnamed protein product [Tilletia controversa]CAD6909476.1 unnamed protein product [Tilletia controversa]